LVHTEQGAGTITLALYWVREKTTCGQFLPAGDRLSWFMWWCLLFLWIDLIIYH